MSLQRLYRTVSILVVFALLLNATAFLAVKPADAAPVKSEAKAPQAQGALLDIRVSVRNRDGTPLSGVDIKLSVYDGPYTGQ